MHDFSISVAPTRGWGDNEPFGLIVIGAWQETFAVVPLQASEGLESLERLWRNRLRELVDGASAVVLPAQPGRGWVLYREDSEVFVQEQLFLVRDSDGELMLDAKDFQIRARTRGNAEEEVSEWVTSLEAIKFFLAYPPYEAGND